MLTRTKTLFSTVAKRTKIPFQPLATGYSFSNRQRETLKERFDRIRDQNKPKTDDINTEAQVAENFTSEDLIKSDYGLASYMLRIYRTTGLSIGGFLGGGYLLSGLGIAHPFGMMLGGLAVSLGSIYSFNRTPQVPGTFRTSEGKSLPTLENPLSRKLLFAGVIAGNAMMVSPLVAMLSLANPMIIPAATALSVSVMAGSSLYSLKAKHGSFSGWAATLYGALLGTIGLNVISLLTYAAIGPNIFSMMCGRIDTYFGIGLFTAFQIYDTQNAIQEYKEGRYDHLGHTINFFLNFVNLFVRIAEILRSYFD